MGKKIDLKEIVLASVILLGCLALPSQVLAASTGDEVNMDEVKIKLLSKGQFKGKKIAGPNKLLLQLKIAKELKQVKVSPETVNVENLDLLELNEPGTIIGIAPADPLSTIKDSK